ncbi:MOSC domain-containing protein [Dyadobacter beijingensis]|nr:MOSC N-terminal beta barrel domain-containing protein [Dyadobacter beijingensis]
MNPNQLPVHSTYLSEIWIYPVKSLAGFRVPSAHAGWPGLRYDRQWMVVDAHGRFLTQREMPQMALLQAEIGDNGLLLSAIGQSGAQVFVPVSKSGGPLRQVKVWDDTVIAYEPSAEANRWLSDRLDRDVALVAKQPDVAGRTYRIPGHAPQALSFADDFPYHLISQSSLDELNTQLDEPVDVRRFRPNFVISGASPYEEDALSSIAIGGAEFAPISPCERCVMVNVDPRSGEKGRQPLKTLAGTRRRGNRIHFGQNVVAVREGTVAEGDPVLIGLLHQ